jgi:NAD(P) transhydrogenase
MQTKKYDVIVIGTGPGGEGAAMKATKSGKRVAVIEKYDRVGGGCSHWGTIPSKSLRHAAQQLVDFKTNPLFEKYTNNVEYPHLVKTAESVISKQVKMRQSFYERNDIDIYYGNATFVDKNSIEVKNTHHVLARLDADYFVIATGSRPYHPKDIDFTHPRVFDSDTILKLDYSPHSITIYGAGVIGCEYASIFRSIGTKVNLVNTRDKLLAFLDDEIIDALAYHLREQGILIRHNEEYNKAELTDNSVILHMKSGKQIKSEVFLFANGRTGNSKDLGLENIGLKVNTREQLEVNENYQTLLPHIYAVGDIIGYPSLASAAYDQGRFASTHIVEGKCDFKLVQSIPTGIYTSPEISSIGKTENTVILDEEAMSALNSSTWEYNWAPTSGEALVGRYIVEIEIEETGGDFIRIYDEFTIISSTNNSVYLNIPSNGNILKGNKNVSWDNSQRPGTINIQSNLYS